MCGTSREYFFWSPRRQGSAFGSSISFLKWSASKRCFDAKIASAGPRWAHPPERTVAAVASAVGLPERTPEPPEVGAEERETPDERRRLQKLAARASEAWEDLAFMNTQKAS